MHEGGDKSAVPCNWQIYDKEKYQMVTCLFQEYLATCYSKCYASTYPKPVVQNHLAQEECDACKLLLELDGLISMVDELPGDLDIIEEVQQDMEKSSGAQKKASMATGTDKGKAKKRPHETPESSIEQSEDDSSDAEDDGGNGNEDEDISNHRCCFPLPFSTLRVNYGMPVGSSIRCKLCLVKLKGLYRQADSPWVEGK